MKKTKTPNKDATLVPPRPPSCAVDAICSRTELEAQASDARLSLPGPTPRAAGHVNRTALPPNDCSSISSITCTASDAQQVFCESDGFTDRKKESQVGSMKTCATNLAIWSRLPVKRRQSQSPSPDPSPIYLESKHLSGAEQTPGHGVASRRAGRSVRTSGAVTQSR